MEFLVKNFEEAQALQSKGFVNSINLKNEKVKLTNVENVIIHKLTSINHKMTIDEFNRLCLSISDIGQTIPVLTWRGKLVDGRHRLAALKRIGISQIKYLELKHKLTINEVKDIIMSTENRRNRTKSQLAIDAYNYTLSENVSYQFAADHFGVSKGMLTGVKTILKKFGSNIIKEMSEQGVAKLPNGKYAKTLSMIFSYMKSIKELKTKPKENIRPDLKNIIDQYDAMVGTNDIEGLSYLKNMLTDKIDKVNKKM